MVDNVLLQAISLVFLGVMLKYRTIEMLLTKDQDENTFYLTQKRKAVAIYISISVLTFLTFQIVFTVILAL